VAAQVVLSASEAQAPNRLPQTIDVARTVVLPNHHPLWANAANSIGGVPANTSLNQFTLVLTRSAAQEQAFQQLLADQQNPASPEYHHWLTPSEVGERFGVSDADMSAIEGWLQSQGMHVNWVSPSRIFVGFGGAAADVGRAFGTELRYYNVNGAQRMSVAADPVVPQALASAIEAVRGLYSIDEQPGVRSTVQQSADPELSFTGGSHFVVPKDFATIYDIPAAYSGAGVTVGIVSWSRTNFADFDNFRQKTGTSFPDPTEIVPTSFGGIDPGPAYTTQQSCSNCLSGQMEATLDVERVGSTAQEANILLLVSAHTGSGGGIGADAQYLVNTTPVPAQVMSISFGACELSAGSSGVAYWNTIFQQAAAEGISVFVSSGDSGASGCDTAFSPPPTSPAPNSPNYICSSQYATCLGGTQFNDTSSPSVYWNSTNSSGFASAISYIPEGTWNESTTTSVAGSGGGVSGVMPTPWWQTGIGVPAARTGRYTPDISFTSAGHDGYFGCLAASGGDCAGSRFSFIAFEGTSAAAPGMAGITALLDQKLGSAQGNLNPGIYELATSNPSAFHDATVETSGVTNCDVNTVSICNNSVASRTSLSGGQAGYQLQAGFDEVTGLGSLDVTSFLYSYGMTTKATPTVTVMPAQSSITTAQSLSVDVTVSGGNGSPTATGSVVLTSGSYTSSAMMLSSGAATINVSAGLLASGAATLTVIYTPDSSSSPTYNSATGTNTVMVTTAPGTTPTVTVTPSPSSITTAQALNVAVTVSGGAGNPIPTGVITLTSGTYTAATTLTGGAVTLTLSAGALAVGTDTLDITYTPDSASSATYNSARGSNTVTVTTPPSAAFTVSGTALIISAGATSANTSLITVTPVNGFTGNVIMTASIVAGPSAATNSPTLSFETTTPVSISGTNARTAILTVTTITSQQAACAASSSTPRKISWYSGGGAVLACVLLFGIGPRRRKFCTAISLLVLLVALAGGAIACGGSKSVSCTPTTIARTTAGNYTINITGTSGSTTASGTIPLTVQ
jgi:subtilase family serine protease